MENFLGLNRFHQTKSKLQINNIRKILYHYRASLTIVLGFFLVVFCASIYYDTAFKKSGISFPKEIVQNELIVEFQPYQSPDELEALASTPQNEIKNLLWEKMLFGGTPAERIADLKQLEKKNGVVSVTQVFKNNPTPALSRFYIVTFNNGANLPQLQQELLKWRYTRSVDPSIVMHSTDTPNDPAYVQGKMWDMTKIHMEDAWGIAKGSASVKVAVIDTGIDYTHEDIPTNTIKGPVFSTGAVDSTDQHGHGTHVAGTIGAVTNNGKGTVGVNWNITLVGIKVLSGPPGGSASGSTEQIAQGIQAAVDANVNVMNMSLGGNGQCPSLYQAALQNAKSKNIVVSIAAGNNGTDASGFTPANCGIGIIVGNTTETDTRNTSSNYGSIVKIAAPGTNIASTYINNQYQYMTGTSQASPHVAGAAALLLSLKPNLSANQVERCLIDNADPIQTDQPIGPRLNVSKALSACANLPTTPTNGPPTPTTVENVVTPTTVITPFVTPQAGYKVQGVVFTDTNRNNAFDPGELGYAGALVQLTGPVDLSTTSASDGTFTFTQVGAAEGYKLTAKVNGYLVSSVPPFSLTTTHQIFAALLPIDPQVTISPNTPTPTQPIPTAVPTTPAAVTPTKKVTPTPVPYACHEDPNCTQEDKNLHLCQLICTPQ